jgi:putative inorganic carbon (HCO3(-)) transporter
MPDLIYNLKENEEKNSLFTSPKKWLRKQVMEEKLLNSTGFFVFTGLAVLTCAAVGALGVKGAMILFALILGLPIVVGSLFNIKMGLIFLLLFSFAMATLYRLVPKIPLGLVLDVMTCVLMFGIFIQQLGKRDWRFLNNTVSKFVLVWLFYNILEVANPDAASKVAWAYSVRSMAGILVLYYIALYAIDSLRFGTVLIKYLVALGFIGAVYGIFQEYYGFLSFELEGFIHNPIAFELMFQAGRFRRFSMFTDPVVFGVLITSLGILSLVLSMGPFSPPKRIFLAVSAVLCFFSMSFAGTRTAYVLIPIGVIFYVLLSHSKKLIMLLGIFAVLGAGVIVMPTGNSTLLRIQSAFRPNQDASFKFRLKNQLMIKPFIRSHPMGGGLGSVGVMGKRFTPGTFLANFPPDSGFVRVAVEQGFIGLLIYFALLFIVLKEGIRAYFRCKDERIKIYYAGLLAMFYSLCVASYTQEIFNMFPITVVFCITMALISRLKDFDPANTDQKNPVNNS